MTTTASDSNRANAPRSTRGKLNRYTAVSIVAAAANIIAYSSWLRFTDLHPTGANAAAAAMVAFPAFLVNRRWVWKLDGRHSIHRELLPYYLFTTMNVTISTLLAWFLARRNTSDPVLVIATFSVYTTTWLLRFLFLDRVLFRRGPDAVANDDQSIIES